MSILRTFKEGNQVTVETTKQKDIEEPEPFDLQLMAHGKSAVLTPLPPGQEALTQVQMHVLKVLQDGPAEWVSKSELKATCADTVPESTFYKTLNFLIKKGYVDQTDGKSKFLRYIPEEERQK
jgi:hypothetical protein